MDELILERTQNTPLVNFNPNKGILKLEGRSIPENPGDFYDQLFNWLDEYFKSPYQTTKFEMRLEYMNSGSSKYILGLFKKIQEYYEKGINCEVNWYYEEDDESILDLGEHYKSSLDLPFNLIEL
ncbi:MAG: DUF1987 domain-containing protein [Bacteroidales bacterium]|nr:DUF1987 domain-containing protein [Bacteroidales bacterium]